MIWLRKWRVLVTDAKDEVALDVSDLHITFEARYARETESFATVRIYNLNRETETRIISEGDRVIVEAGYQSEGDSKAGQYGVIFDGQVIYPSRSKESNTDYVLTLLCVDGSNKLNKNFVSMACRRGQNQRQLLQAACANARVPIPVDYISQGLSPQKLPRGKVLFGVAKDMVENIARGNAATYYMVNGVLKVTKTTDPVDGEGIVVTPETGLIGTPTQTQYGADFKLLLNPSVKLGMLIQLKNSEINERQAKPGEGQTPLDTDRIYQAIEVTFVGDTRGNDWYTNVTGISRDGKGALAAILSNASQNANGV